MSKDKFFAGQAVMRRVSFKGRKESIRTMKKESHRKGDLTDLGGNHDVQLEWHMNADAKRDKVFKLTIDEKEVYLELEELMFYTRLF